MYWWSAHEDLWVLPIPRRGIGYIFYEPTWRTSYRWAVKISTEEGLVARAIASGIEDTLEEAQRQVEDTFDMIEEY